MEGSPPYPEDKTKRVQPLDDPFWIGAEAALKRASDKAITRALAAGLAPVIDNLDDIPEEILKKYPLPKSKE